MKFKREYELAIFATIIIISIAFSLYYSGFTGELPTGMAFVSTIAPPYMDVVVNQCIFAGAPPPYPIDTDGDGVPDACELSIPGMNPLITDSDGDFVIDSAELGIGGPAMVVNPLSTPLSYLSGPLVVYGTDGLGRPTASGTITFADISGAITFVPGASGAFSVSNGDLVSAVVVGSSVNFIVTHITSDLSSTWTFDLGDGTPSPAIESRGFYATASDGLGWPLDLTGTFTWPPPPEGEEPRIGGGGSNDCESEVTNTWWNGDVLMVELIVRQKLLMAGVSEEEVAGMYNARISYPLDGVKIDSVTYVGPENLVEGTTRTNVRRIYRVGITGLNGGDRLDLIGVIGSEKWGWNPNKCFDGIFVPEKPFFEQPLPPCTPQQIVNSVEVSADNVAVDGDFFSFNINAEFTPPGDCMYTGAGVVTLTTYDIVGPDGALAIDTSGKKGKSGAIGSDGFVSGGGISPYFPGGDGAEPGVPPEKPVPGEPDELDLSIIVFGYIDGIYPFNTPTTVSFPITRVTDVPTTVIDIPDDIINFFDIPPGYYPPGFIPIPEPIPNPIPYPDPTPFPDPIPDVIKKIFYPQPRGEYLKLYTDTVQQGEVSTDEGKKIDETKAFQLTNGVANGRVEVIGPWGGRDDIVRLFLESDGEQVSALRSVILSNKAVPDLKVFTKETLPLGQFTVGEWGSNIALRTNTDGGAFYQMDYNSLEDGQYSLIAVSGNMFKMFYFEIAKGQVIFLKVPPKKLIANLKLIARELGVPVAIQRLGEDEVVLYYKDENWNNAAGEQTAIPEDLT